MPTVVHFRCPKCHQLTTHDIVYISDDLKHDAHLVKAFTTKSLAVLKENNVDIHKIIRIHQPGTLPVQKQDSFPPFGQQCHTYTEKLFWSKAW